MEVCQADVLSIAIPPRTGDPEVQHPGLSAEVCVALLNHHWIQNSSTATNITDTGWNNFKKPFARCDKCSACANNVGMLSPRQMKVKLECYRRMIRHEREAGTVRWPVVGADDNDDDDCDCARECMSGRRVFGMYIFSVPWRGWCVIRVLCIVPSLPFHH